MGSATLSPASLRSAASHDRPARASSIPAAPARAKADTVPKRGSLELSHFPTKRRRLASLAAGEESASGLSAATHGARDELSLPEPPCTAQPRRPSPMAAGESSIDCDTDGEKSEPSLAEPCLSACDHSQASASPAMPRTPPSSRPVPCWETVRAFGTDLAQSPPRSAHHASADKQLDEAASLVAALEKEYTDKKASLREARSWLGHQLATYDGSRPVAVNDSVKRIRVLQGEVKELLRRLREAQDLELELGEQRDDRQLDVRLEHAHLFQRLTKLGPTGVAAILRVLLSAAGAHRDKEGAETDERIAEILKAFDEDFLREQLSVCPAVLPGTP